MNRPNGFEGESEGMWYVDASEKASESRRYRFTALPGRSGGVDDAGEVSKASRGRLSITVVVVARIKKVERGWMWVREKDEKLGLRSSVFKARCGV